MQFVRRRATMETHSFRVGLLIFKTIPQCWDMRKRFRLLTLALSLAMAISGVATAADDLRERPILFSADSLTYDPNTRVTTAVGNVEISQGERILFADKIVYYETEDRVVADGNVALLEPSGEVVFADHFDITGDLRDGVIDNVRIILEDGTRIAAANGTRSEGNITQFNKTVYSPCFVCDDTPDEAPLWQLKAVKVVHNEEEREIEFEEATFEIAGVPVAYLPYMSRPDPTVKRKTGFLVPSVGRSSDLGFVAQAPFFWAITPNIDMTLTPWITTNEGPVLEAQYRHSLTNGNIKFDSSITRDSRERVRGHFFGEARFDINESWRAGLDLKRSRGRTYLRRYNFDNSQTLRSRAFAEAFKRRNYFVANGYSFQGLEDDDDDDDIPIVLPLMDYYLVTEPDSFGGRADLRLNLAVLERTGVDNTDTRRLSARAGYEIPMIGPFGSLYKVFANLYADGYHADNVISTDGTEENDGFAGRLFPLAGARWSLPLVRDDGDFQQVIEPIVEGIVAPTFGNKDDIPNEDSQDLELDETNILSRNRLPGLDQVEEGPRFNYGLRWSFFGGERTSASVFAGQSYRFFNDDKLGQARGLNDNFSDFVSAVEINYDEYVRISYRNRIDRKEFEPRRHELSANLGIDMIDLDVRYVLFEDDTTQEFDGREEVEFEVGTQFSRYWRNETFGTQDLSGGSTTRELGSRLIYEDECLLFEVEYSRSDIEDDDIDSSDSIFFRIGLKTLGDISTGFTRGGSNTSEDRNGGS